MQDSGPPRPDARTISRSRFRRVSSKLFVAAALVMVALACGASAGSVDPFDSVAQLRGHVCGRTMVGSAVVIAEDRLLTVAHNVVGSTEGEVVATFENREQHPVTVVGIDPRSDLALLSAPTGQRPILGLADPVPAESGRLIRLRQQAMRTELHYTDAELITATGRDLYGEPNEIRRANVRVRAAAGPGYSGGPVLNADDQMTGLIYATARLEDVTYANAAAEVESFLASVDPDTAVDPGPCP